MLRISLAAILAFAALVIVMSWSQDEILFPTDAVPPAGPLPSNAEQLQVQTPGGETLHGLHISSGAPASGPRMLILGFGGNAWNGQEVASYLHELYPEAEIVAFHYRGYRPSTGRPSADALIEDAPLVYDAAVKQVHPARTIAVGFSIGSGVAASLARSRKLDGLILVTPFDSLKAVAGDQFPWLPVGPLFQHEIDAAGALAKADVRTAIITAERDTLIRPQRSDGLRSAARHLSYNRTVNGAGHNDIYQRSDFHHAMRDALKAVTS